LFGSTPAGGGGGFSFGTPGAAGAGTTTATPSGGFALGLFIICIKYTPSYLPLFIHSFDFYL
jgi:hypothetical protein